MIMGPHTRGTAPSRMVSAGPREGVPTVTLGPRGTDGWMATVRRSTVGRRGGWDPLAGAPFARWDSDRDVYSAQLFPHMQELRLFAGTATIRDRNSLENRS